MHSNSDTTLLSVEEMARADRLAVEAGVASLDLMEAAGHAVFEAIRGHWPPGRAALLCGPGNNGGDGFVVARLLAEAGWRVHLGLLSPVDALKCDAAANAGRWSGDIETLGPDLIADCDIVVDAMFGAGLARPLEDAALETVLAINESDIPCVAVDMPSGVDGDSGDILGDAPRARITVTFFRKKPGHLQYPGRHYCGEVVVAGIGIPDQVLGAVKPNTWENSPDLWAANLPRPRHGDHKYTRGHLLIVGGDEMTGAARLAARGARRVGAGMVTIAAPEAALPIYLAGDPGQIVVGLPPAARLDALLGQRRRSAALIGPGNGVGQTTRQHAIDALRTSLPAVIDADGLTSFEDAPADLFGWIQGPCVLTPHDGEFARLFPDLTGSRLQRCRAAAKLSGAVVLLKGADTVIAAPDGRALINSNAPASLATAGSGDVLAGMAAALLAGGVPALAAAAAAVWLHGEAAQRFGATAGLIAEDLPEQLPALLEELAHMPK